MNKYELEHVVTGHARMSREEWQGAYRAAWDAFYTPEHLETIVKRAAASGIRLASLKSILLWFSSATAVENLHPLQWGILRVKHRADRRPGLPIEPAWTFYPNYLADFIGKHYRLVERYRRLSSIIRKVQADPRAASYMDEALTPVADEDSEHMGLYTQNQAARIAVTRERRVAGLALAG